MMLRRLLVAVPWLALATCVAPPENAASRGFTEGSRLKAVYQEAEGAPPRFISWFDTQLGVDCTFADVSPDRMVCFPSNNTVNEFAIDFVPPASPVVSSGRCTFPLERPPACARPHFYVQSPMRGAPCGTEPRLFYLRDGTSSATPDCEVPLDGLITGTYRHSDGPGRIVPLSIVASDGSIQDMGTLGWVQGGIGGEVYPGVMSTSVAWDTQRKEIVSASGNPMSRRWHPTTWFGAGGFVDAACSVPAAFAYACPYRASRAAFSGDCAGDCSENEAMAFRELGDPGPVGAAAYYKGGVDACTSDVSPNDSYISPMRAVFPLGAPIPATAFAETLEVRTGTKQVQLVQAGTADGPAGVGHGWPFFDSVHGWPCGTAVDQEAADGTLRCRPEVYLSVDDSRVYADAACSIPLLSLPEPSPSAPSFAERREYTSATVDGCEKRSIRHHYFSVGERYTGTVFSNLNGGCAAVDLTPTEGQPAWTLHVIGPEVPAETFAPLRYVRPN